MHRFDLITLTGADENTSIDRLQQLVADNERLEIGLLYTASPEGRNRYPGREWLARAALAVTGRCAIHICGQAARRHLLDAQLSDLMSHAARVQVNGLLSVEEAQSLAPLTKALIVQHNESNDHLAHAPRLNVALLVDSSGGRGCSPARWRRPDTSKRVGFAGGLGPTNLAAQLPLIAEVAGDQSWVDMESRLRREDWFDLGLARECLSVFNDFHARPGQTGPLHHAAQTT